MHRGHEQLEMAGRFLGPRTLKPQQAAGVPSRVAHRPPAGTGSMAADDIVSKRLECAMGANADLKINTPN